MKILLSLLVLSLIAGLIWLLGMRPESGAGSSQPGKVAEPSWPHFLGRDSDLAESAPSLEGWKLPPTAEVRWRQAAGSGYSQPVVGNGFFYLAFCGGEKDILAAFRLADGEEQWRYEIAPAWRGVDGSDDGPISTPALYRDKIVALGPRGHLVTLDALTGREVWRVDLVAEYAAKAATYGFASSPAIADGVVVCQMGAGEGRSVAGFDLADGRLKWSCGDDVVEYQSPMVTHLAGMTQSLSVTATEVCGLDPKVGTVHWRETYNKKAGDHSCPSLRIGEDRFLITTVADAVAYAIDREGAQMKPREIWRNREFKRSYAVPVSHQGFVYGFSSDFLVCVDAATGTRRWKSRRPGAGALLLLGPWLLVWTQEGRLVFLDPTPEEYREVASVPLMDKGSLVNPVWTGESLLLRGGDHLVSVDIRPQASSTTQEPGRATAGPAAGPLRALFDRLSAASGASQAEARVAAMDAFFVEHPEMPLVEGEGMVHFLYRGEAEDVGLVFGVSPVETPLPMTRVPETDLWYRTERCSLRGAYPYRYEIDGERPVPDPRNPIRGGGFLPTSLLRMSGFRSVLVLAPDPVSVEGKVETVKFKSKLLSNERKVAVYTPAGFDAGRSWPLVVVTSGSDRDFGGFTQILDAAMGRNVTPAVVAFLDVPDPVDENIFAESLGSNGPTFTRMLVEELLPFLEARYPLSKRPEDRLVMGNSLSAVRALDVALRYPGKFGGVAIQSPALIPAIRRELQRFTGAGGDRPRVYLSWCERDLVARDEAADVARSSLALKELLERCGCELTTEVLPGCYGWETWATRTEDILKQFLPMGGGK